MTYVEETHRLLGALLRLILSSSNFRNTLRSIAVSLSFGDLSWRRLVAATASRPLLRAPLAPLPFLVFSRLSSLDNNAATVEIFLVELSNSFFDLGNVFDRNKAVASRAGASLNNLDRQAMRSVLSNKYKSEILMRLTCRQQRWRTPSSIPHRLSRTQDCQRRSGTSYL